MKKYYGWFVVIIALIGFCSFHIQAQELNVRFQEKLVIGEDDNVPLENLFSGPTFIDTDSQNRIYIAEKSNVRVFSENGEYLKTIGSQGRGPGEFLDISALAIGVNDELIIYDNRNFRLTLFYNLGDSLESISPQGWEKMDGRRTVQNNIIPISNDQFAITAMEIDPLDQRPLDEMDNRIVHLVSKDFTTYNQSYIDVFEYLLDPEAPLQRRASRFSNYLLAQVPNNKLAVAHEMFNGNIYMVDYTQETPEVQELGGNFVGYQMYEELDGSFQSHRNKRYGIVGGSGGTYQKKLGSLGLFANSNGIMNFVYTIEGEKGEYFIEFFTKEGEYRGYTNIDNDFIIQEGMRQSFDPKHIDKDNKLYYADYSDGNVAVRVIEIIVEE